MRKRTIFAHARNVPRKNSYEQDTPGRLLLNFCLHIISFFLCLKCRFIWNISSDKHPGLACFPGRNIFCSVVFRLQGKHNTGSSAVSRARWFFWHNSAWSDHNDSTILTSFHLLFPATLFVLCFLFYFSFSFLLLFFNSCFNPKRSFSLKGKESSNLFFQQWALEAYMLTLL